MKLAILGATGLTGNQLVLQALEKGYEVSILSRTLPPKGVPTDSRVKVTQGSSTDQSKVAEVFKDCEAAIISLGNGPTVCSESQPIINNAAAATGVKKLIVITSLGAGDSYQFLSWFTTLVVNVFIAKPIADKNIQEEIVKEFPGDWTLVRPGGLTNGPLVKECRASHDLGGGKISRADVAHFILQHVLNTTEFSKRAITIVY